MTTVFEKRKLRQKMNSSQHLSLAKKVRQMALKSIQCTYFLHFIVYFIICTDLPVCTKKHCQRHNGPEGCVHITSSYTNLDQILFSESRLTSKSQPNITISTILKLKILTKPCAQSLNKSLAL